MNKLLTQAHLLSVTLSVYDGLFGSETMTIFLFQLQLP